MGTGPPAQVLERIHRLGSLSFAEYVELALYDPQCGFFTKGGAAGRRGHFLTSPELGPLFSAVVARALDTWWQELGRPDPFVVVEAGAGTGTLAAGMLGAGAECAPAMRYVLVERSKALRAQQADRLPLEPPEWVIGGNRAAPSPGSGPLVTALGELPAVPVTGVVLANELLDNLPFLLLEKQGHPGAGSGSGWQEVRVAEDGGGLVEVMVPAPDALAGEAEEVAPHSPTGGRVPLQHAAHGWLRRALSLVERGRVVVVDYADSTESLSCRPWLEWVRTYRDHTRGDHPLQRVGSQDITCEVAVDQLARVRPPSSDRSQAEFLAEHGIGDLVAAARADWLEGAAAGSLAALRSRSTVTEGAALVDPQGLGAFRVLEWQVP